MKTGVSMAPCGVFRTPRRAPLGSVFEISNENSTHPVYQEKIQAPPILSATQTAQTAIAILSDLPFSFLGFTAAKPIEISSSVQMLKMSMDFPNAINALGVLSGRNAPTLVAIGFSRSTVPGAFKYRIRMNRSE